MLLYYVISYYHIISYYITWYNIRFQRGTRPDVPAFNAAIGACEKGHATTTIIIIIIIIINIIIITFAIAVTITISVIRFVIIIVTITITIIIIIIIRTQVGARGAAPGRHVWLPAARGRRHLRLPGRMLYYIML